MAAGLAARVLARQVENHALVAADPVEAVVAGLPRGERILHELGRVQVGQTGLLRLLLCEKRAAAGLDENGAREGRVHVEREEPGRGLPDAAELLELLLDGEGLAGDDELRGRGREEEREHFVGC